MTADGPSSVPPLGPLSPPGESLNGCEIGAPASIISEWTALILKPLAANTASRPMLIRKRASKHREGHP